VAQICILDDQRIITASGPDRASFLQGQLTQDVAGLVTGAARMAGWADAKGRLWWAGQLFLHEDRHGLLVPAAIATALLARLKMYVLRASVQVAIAELAVVGAIGEFEHALAPGWERLRLAGDEARSLLVGPPAGLNSIVHAPGVSQESRHDWELRDIRAGIPAIGTATSGEFVPQMVNLDLLDGISFSKGCYTGQEIIARMKYLGRVKRRMLRFACPGEVAAGATLYAERGPVGQVVRAASADSGSELLAVVPLDDLARPLFADEARSHVLNRLPLPYSFTE
jgi:folate-binding protein YgfZ